MPLVSLPDVKDQLNITRDDYDPALNAYIAAVDAIVERHTGDTVSSQAFTETLVLDSWTDRIIVSNRPLTAVTSVVAHDGSTTYDTTGAVVKSAGVIVMTDRLCGAIDVAYIAGLADPPAHYKQAALIIVQHLWMTRRGPVQPNSSVLPDSMAPREAGYAIPNVALELLGHRNPVVA